MSQRKLASERVIINSPMSFAGAAQRSFRIRGNVPVLRWLLLPVAILLMLLWWAGVITWYVAVFGLFGLLVFPYRLLRRGARKRKAEALRHRELLQQLERHS